MDHSKSIKNQEESAKLDKHFGFNLWETLQQMETDLDGLALEIVIKESHPNGKTSHRSFMFKLKDDVQRVTKSQQGHLEDIEKLIQRLAVLQKNHSNLLQEATAKVSEIQKEYCGRDFTIDIVKHKIRSDAIQRHEKLSSTTSTLRSNDRYHNTDIVKHKMPSDAVPRHEDSSTLKRKNSSNHHSDSEATTNIAKRKLPSQATTKHERSSTLKSSNRHPYENQLTQRRCIEEYPKISHKDSNMLIIGPNGTQMHRKSYETIRWRGGICTTRDLCDIIFGQRTLARHSDRGQLDPSKTSDITYLVCSKFKVTGQLVRDAIASKCVEAARKNQRFPEKRRFY